MHRNAESELGRRGNELGQYKSLTDQLLEFKRPNDLVKGGADPDEVAAEKVEISSTELLDDPTSAVYKVVETALQNQNRKQEKQDAERALKEQQAAFLDKHPDAEEIANSSQFVEWVGKSPALSKLGYEAAQGDLVAGDALLTEWKNRQEQQEAPAQEDSLKEARKASTERAGASQVADTPTGKTYRRLDLIRLKIQDPEAYSDPAFQNEIMQAYAEGRVK